MLGIIFVHNTSTNELEDHLTPEWRIFPRVLCRRGDNFLRGQWWATVPENNNNNMLLFSIVILAILHGITRRGQLIFSKFHGEEGLYRKPSNHASEGTGVIYLLSVLKRLLVLFWICYDNLNTWEIILDIAFRLAGNNGNVLINYAIEI